VSALLHPPSRPGRLEVVRRLPDEKRTGVFALAHAAALWGLVKEAAKAWQADRAASMGAALAYYTAFSIAPLLIVVVAIAGLVFGRDAAQAALIDQLQNLLGTGAGDAINDMLRSASELGTGILAIVIGLLTLLVAATTAFVELQDDLDRIWKAEPRVGSGILNLLKSRLLSFAMVLFIGFLLTVSLAFSAALAAMGRYMFADMEMLLEAVNFFASLVVITVLFAMIYKVLPNVKIAWQDVWIGAAITALLFTVGKLLIGLYIGKSSVASSFGAAGPFVVILVWIYYSTQIFLFGAELTARYAARRRPVNVVAREAGSPARTTTATDIASASPDNRRADEAFLIARRPHAKTLSDSSAGRRQ
jgi:membrane protein